MGPCDRGRTRLAAPIAIAIAALVAAAPARAEGDAAAAREAYERGAAAFDRGDFAAAAVELARADAIVPHAVTLELALRSATRADDAAIAAELLGRSRRAEASGALAEAVRAAEARFADRLGTIVVRCPARPACTATVDGRPIAIGVERLALAGDHAIEVGDDRGRTRHAITVEAGRVAELVAPPAPPPAPAAPRPAPPSAGAEARGLSPAWVGVGAGVTAVLGGFAIASGVDTARKHDAFVGAPSDDAASAGRAAQTRTNVLLAATGAAALATVGVAIFAVRWSGPARAPAVGLAVGPAGARLDGRF